MQKFNLFESEFDIIQLPSRGLFYSGLNSTITIKYLTAKEEKILTTPQLFESGKAINMVIDNNVYEDNFIGSENLLICDKQAIILFLRSTSFGDKYPIKFNCQKCHNENEIDFFISELEINDLNYFPDEDGTFSFTLPKMKINNEKVLIKFTPLTVKEELMLMEENRNNPDSEITNLYKTKIKSINNINDKNYITKILHNMSMTDSAKLRSYMDKVEPRIKNELKFDCEFCKNSFNSSIEFNDNFLGITPSYRTQMMDEIFNLTYYHKGGLTRADVMSMSISERRWELNRIVKEVEKTNKETERATKK